MANKKVPADKYVKKRKNIKLWHRLLLAAGCIVVFVTTYMLILPAITAEIGSIELFDESVSSGSSIIPEEDNIYIEETTEEPTDDFIYDSTDDASEETSDFALEETTASKSSESSDETAEQTTGEEESGGSAEEAEETTAESFSSEETTETAASTDTGGGSGGGGLTATITTEDGAVITLTAVEQVGELEITNESVINLLVALAESGSTEATLTNTYTCTYDADSDDFDLVMDIAFTIPQSCLQTYGSGVSGYGYTFTSITNGTLYYSFQLPSDITLTDSLIYANGESANGYHVYQGTLGNSGSAAFDYYFVPEKQQDGSIIYTVVMVFYDSYLSGLEEGADITGTMNINASVSTECYTDEGTLSIAGGSIVIPAEDIKWSSDSSSTVKETATEELIVYKTAVRNSDGTLSYTVRILTTKGTGDPVTINDIITNTAGLEGLDEDSLVSITYSSGTIGAYKSGSLYTVGEDSLSTETDIPKGNSNMSYSGAAYYYYDSSGNLNIVLPELEAPADDYTADWMSNSWYAENYTVYNEYYITYTYEVDPEIDESYYLSNTATANTYDDLADVELEDSSTATITVRGTSIITKTGYLSGSTITWTVNIGDGSTDLTGYTLTDNMFADLTETELIAAITATYSSGTAGTPEKGIDYKILTGTDSEGNTIITGIEFLSDTYTNYTIKYTTTAEESWGTTTYTNTAELTSSDEKGTVYDAEYSVKVSGSGSGSLGKTLDSYTVDSDGNYILKWTSSIEVPGSGIPAGTTIIDYVSGNGGYFTAAQALEIVEALETAFGDNIGEIYFSTTADSTMWNIDQTYWGGYNNWISSSAIDKTDTTTKYYVFKFTTLNDIEYYETANNITVTYTLVEETVTSAALSAEIANEEETEESVAEIILETVISQVLLTSSGDEPAVTNTLTAAASYYSVVNTDGSYTYYYYDNNISFSYETTADVSGVTENQAYYNTIYVQDLNYSASAEYDYKEKVVKYGVNSSNSTVTGKVNLYTTEDTKEISWVVRVILSGDYTDYTVTDILPEGVSLKSVSVSNYNSNYDELTDENTTYTYLDSGNVAVSYDVETTEVQTETTTVDTNGSVVTSSYTYNADKVTVSLTDNRTDKSDYTVYIKFTCEYTFDSDEITAANGADIKKTFANTAYVTAGGTDYGESNEQYTYVTHTEDETKTNEQLDKDALFSQNDNTITYTLDINPDGIYYTTGYPNTDDDGEYTGDVFADLTVTDILSYYTYPSYGIARSVSLTSVKLYYASLNSDGTAKLDDNGKLVKGDEIDSTDYSWTYSSVQPQYSNQVTNTITLTIPNGTPLIFEYVYKVSVVNDDDAQWEEYTAGATNYAELSAEDLTISTTDPITTNNRIETSGTSAQVDGGSSYTIYKVDKDNFSVPLEGAVFDLYVYNSSATKFVKLDSYETGSAGTISVSGKYVKATEESPITEYFSGDEYKTGTFIQITSSDGTTVYNINVNTMCYLVESMAPDYYKRDGTKHYFYFGESIATMVSSVSGYDSSDSEMASAVNAITSHAEYIVNEHSSDYYADKTNISVVKLWEDSDGNEYEKADGSITFSLYRIYRDVNGVVGFSPEHVGSGDQEVPESDTSTINITYGPSYGIAWDGSVSTYDWGSESITVNNVDGGTVDIKITDITSGYWLQSYQTITIYDLDTGNTLASISGTDSNWVDHVCTYSLTLDGTDKNLYIYVNTWTSGSYTVSLSSDNEVETTTQAAEESSEITVETTTETTTIGNTYTHNFEQDDTKVVNAEDGSISYELSGKDTFFTITGNLSYSTGGTDAHGTAQYDIGGDGNFDAEDILNVCLKMEKSTSIKFSPEKDGYLTLVFNEAGGQADIDKGTTITNSIYISVDGSEDKEEHFATDNILKLGLEGGHEYEITKYATCYIFYMSFVEQTLAAETSDPYLHSFNDGTKSSFYKISGSLGSANSTYGSVTYNNEVISEFLKLGSTAEITFNAPQSGILYLVLTDAHGYNKTVGVTLDGVTKEAIDSGLDSTAATNNTVYIVTTRITAGSHTITRINSTEYQLYYIGYISDGDYKNGEVTTSTPYSEYAEIVEKDIVLNSANDWSWVDLDLALTYVDDDGNILGYFSYYVVENDAEGRYITKYYNVTTNGSLGIQSGTIGIANTLDESKEGVTHVSVNKVWQDSDGKTIDSTSPYYDSVVTDEIEVDLYAKVQVYTEDLTKYTVSSSHSRGFASGDDAKEAIETDGFFTWSGHVQSSSQLGDLTYNETLYSTFLKLDGSSGYGGKAAYISFESPASESTLKLVTADGYYTSSKYTGNVAFNLTSESGNVYSYVYDCTKDTITSSGVDANGDKLDSSYIPAVSVDTTSAVTSNSSLTDPVITNGLVFTFTLNEAGTWRVERTSDTQPYVYYVDFSYYYKNLADGYGVYIGRYTIDDSTDWSKTIHSLPLYIYDDEDTDNSNRTPIGYYSYYVVEAEPSSGYTTSYEYTMEMGDIVQSFTLNSTDSSKIDIVFHDKSTGTLTTRTVTYVSYTTATDSNGAEYIDSVTIANTSLSAVTTGSVKITNRLKEEEIVLPEAGGDSGFKYILAGVLTSLSAILLLYKRRKGLSAGL